MNLTDFVAYFLLPATTIIFLITNRYYYKKKDTTQTRFNMPVDLFFGNFVASIVTLILLLGIYSYILNISMLSGLRWEIATIYTMIILTLIMGIGVGSHIVVIHIERLLPKKYLSVELQKTLDFYHWPFSHKLSSVSLFLMIYILMLFDLFKGNLVVLNTPHLITLTLFAVISGVGSWIVFVITHITRIMFYTLSVMIISLLIILDAEIITLIEHEIAYFFSIVFSVALTLLMIYRYSHHISESIHLFIHSQFDDGDKVREE